MFCLVVFAFLQTYAQPSSGQAPEWRADELRSLLSRAQAAGRATAAEHRDREFAKVLSNAYRVPANLNENLNNFAARVLKKRKPAYPDVADSQWLLAAAHQFYLDASNRAAQLSRLSTGHADGQYFSRMESATKTTAQQIATMLRVAVDGIPGFVELLPESRGQKYQKRGVLVLVQDQAIVINGLERMHFSPEHQPLRDSPRQKGAYRALVASFTEYNQRMQLLGHYDQNSKRDIGHLSLLLPMRYPALYLNEVVRAARLAKFRYLHFLFLDRYTGRISERLLRIDRKHARHCADSMDATSCLKNLEQARAYAPPSQP